MLRSVANWNDERRAGDEANGAEKKKYKNKVPK